MPDTDWLPCLSYYEYGYYSVNGDNVAFYPAVEAFEYQSWVIYNLPVDDDDYVEINSRTPDFVGDDDPMFFRACFKWDLSEYSTTRISGLTLRLYVDYRSEGYYEGSIKAYIGNDFPTSGSGNENGGPYTIAWSDLSNCLSDTINVPTIGMYWTDANWVTAELAFDEPLLCPESLILEFANTEELSQNGSSFKILLGDSWQLEEGGPIVVVNPAIQLVFVPPPKLSVGKHTTVGYRI